MRGRDTARSKRIPNFDLPLAGPHGSAAHSNNQADQRIEHECAVSGHECASVGLQTQHVAQVMLNLNII
jgi:hypothetical protein